MSLDLNQLLQIHATKRLRLATTVGMQGFVHVDNDPDALVRELIRLAKIGQEAEAQAVPTPRRRAGVADRHDRAWPK